MRGSSSPGGSYPGGLALWAGKAPWGRPPFLGRAPPAGPPGTGRWGPAACSGAALGVTPGSSGRRQNVENFSCEIASQAGVPAAIIVRSLPVSCGLPGCPPLARTVPPTPRSPGSVRDQSCGAVRLEQRFSNFRNFLVFLRPMFWESTITVGY